MARDYTVLSGNRPAATISCPGCGDTIGYYDEANSSYYGCPKCYSFFKYEYEGPPEVLRQFNRKYKPKIAIGSRGIIDGKDYTVVGFMHKNENGEAQEWDEYVLYREGNPYVILVAYVGDWVAIRKSNKPYTLQKLSDYNYTINDNGRRYQLYHSYQFNILYACGEFDWNVLGDEQMIAYEYMSDDRLLVNEVLNGQSDWYWGTDMNARQVAEAFGGKDKDGKSNAALSPDKWPAAKKFILVMVPAVILLQLLFTFLHPQKTVLSSRYTTAPDTTVAANIKPIITEPFDLTQDGGVNIDMKTDVDNEWAELAVTMVNEKTGDEYESSKAIEYYHGYEGGENWSEGDKEGQMDFSHVPAGRYHLNIYPYSETKKYMNIDVTVTQNTIFFSNMWLMLAALMAWPVLRFLKQNVKYSN